MSEIEKALNLIQSACSAAKAKVFILPSRIELVTNGACVYESSPVVASILSAAKPPKPIELPPEIIKTLASWPGDGYGPEIRAVLEAARKAVA